MKLPKMLRNLWVYRRLLALAVLLGVALYFVLSNNEEVKVSFPILGTIVSTSGIVMLVSAGLGAAVCWLVMTFRQAMREARSQRTESEVSSGQEARFGPQDKTAGPTGHHGRTGTEPEKPESEGPQSAGP
jgi:uncharacterized integral membrane protein